MPYPDAMINFSMTNFWLTSGDSVQDCQNKILKVSVDLDCIARIVVLVTSLRFDLSSTERRRLGSYFCPGFIDTPDQASP